MTDDQNTITRHYQQLQSYERGVRILSRKLTYCQAASLVSIILSMNLDILNIVMYF